MQELSPQSFPAAITKGPIIIDFWAAWCGPCRALAPTFEKLSHEFSGKLAFAKFNIEEGRDLAVENGVLGIPCLILFKDGKEVDRIVGQLPEPAMRQKIETALKKVR